MKTCKIRPEKNSKIASVEDWLYAAKKCLMLFDMDGPLYNVFEIIEKVMPKALKTKQSNCQENIFQSKKYLFNTSQGIKIDYILLVSKFLKI